MGPKVENCLVDKENDCSLGLGDIYDGQHRE